jgi:2-amino-4-hydroxy-6-hydroxymethyldihydropteridine diphosphokinase
LPGGAIGVPHPDRIQMNAQIVVGLGSNLGSRESFLRAAVDLLAATPGCTVTALSSLFETEPVGAPGPMFLNAAVNLRTEYRPEQLLERLQSIESVLGRERRRRWEARTIDLDILWSDLGSVSTPLLSVPHPRLPERAFALAPLLEVAPELASTYGSHLRAAGGAPEPCGSLDACQPLPGEARSEDHRLEIAARDRADALAALCTAFAIHTWGGVSGHPLQVSPVRRQCEPGRESEAFVEALMKLIGSGFRPCRAVVSSLEPGLVSGRLVGRPGNRFTMEPPGVQVSEKRGIIELCVYPGRSRLDVVTFFKEIAEG